ncbi:MAG: PepSY domain-containing protein [Clostridia bacterium]|nr:PepSY domain-containing protein [Clostridia bacterium]
MDDNRMRELVQQAVARRCEPLAPDPFLAARVQHAAEQKGEPAMKKKLSAGLVVCIVLVLLSLTALAAVLLTGMEIIEQQAIPVARQNDAPLRVNDIYSHEELVALLRVAEENGITVEDDHIREALLRGEGYYEEETIMAICRAAFGGLYYEWDVEERHWYGEMMVEIGFRDVNYNRLPGEGELPPAEARALAGSLLKEEFPDAPIDDPARYRVVEDFDEGGWYFTYHPRNLSDAQYSIHFSHDCAVVERTCQPQSWETYSETQLMDAINSIYGYRTHTQKHWGLEGWYTFSQMLPGAVHTAAWDDEYDGYLATTYLLPSTGDITAEEACAIAMADAGADGYISADMLLLGKGKGEEEEKNRIWKVTLQLLNDEGEAETRSWEINAATGNIRHRMTFGQTTHRWARYMLFETYEAVRAASMTEADAKSCAIAALQQTYADSTPPLADEAFYDVNIRSVGGGQFFAVMFVSKTVEYGNAYVTVSTDGTAEISYAYFEPLTADNLHSRMSNVQGSALRWEQSVWVEFEQLLAAMPAPTTFEGKLFAAAHYPDASTVKLSLEDAVDVILRDLGTRSDDAVSWVLIDAEPHPVWKIRVSTFPANTLYEVDAMTGEILDRELYVCQNPDFDHDMKMFTLRSAYMPAALEEFGPVRIAMELTVKSDFDAFSYDETVFMNENCYQVTVDGMTVTFTSIDENLPSYRTTILDNGMDAEIEVFDIPEPRPESEGSPYGNG